MKKTITEGSAKIVIDQADVVTKKLEAFYNPKMQLNRDISILLLAALKKKNMNIMLPLAGTGVRGVRMLLELKGIGELVMNDVNPKAVMYMQENLKLNNLASTKNVSIKHQDANTLLCESETGFGYIDIDPFGSPNFLLENAIRRLKQDGVLAVTATDTGALAGTYPNAAKVKYWSTSALCPQQHEMGLRILARKVMLMGLHQDKALIPVLSYHHEHYYRIFFVCDRGRMKAAKLFDQLQSYFHHCKVCAAHWVDATKHDCCKLCGSKKLAVPGPLYAGSLHEKKTIAAMLKKKPNKQIEKILRLALEDATLPLVGYYDTHAICDIHKTRTQSLKYICEQLQKRKYKTALVSTNSVGIRTNAPYKEVMSLFSK